MWLGSRLLAVGNLPDSTRCEVRLPTCNIREVLVSEAPSLETFWAGVGGWTDRQVADGTNI